MKIHTLLIATWGSLHKAVLLNTKLWLVFSTQILRTLQALLKRPSLLGKYQFGPKQDILFLLFSLSLYITFSFKLHLHLVCHYYAAFLEEKFLSSGISCATWKHMVKGIGLQPPRSKVKPQHCHFLAVWSWVNCLISLNKISSSIRWDNCCSYLVRLRKGLSS